MKNLLSLFIITLLFTNVNAQVGVGTKTPANSSILDISSTNNGVLLPRVKLVSSVESLPLPATIPEGTMVFNTTKSGVGDQIVIPGIYIWKDGKWYFPAELAELDEEKNVAVKFNNNPLSVTNFNPNQVSTPKQIDIFNTVEFNDDNAIFEKIDNFQLRIKKNGLYLVSLNLALKQTPPKEDSRLSNYIYMNLNGNLASSKIITLVPQYNPTDVNVNGRFAFGSNSYINAKSGDVLTLMSQRYKDGTNYDGILNYDPLTNSSITLIKIK